MLVQYAGGSAFLFISGIFVGTNLGFLLAAIAPRSQRLKVSSSHVAFQDKARASVFNSSLPLQRAARVSVAHSLLQMFYNLNSM